MYVAFMKIQETIFLQKVDFFPPMAEVYWISSNLETH